jgi:predicted neutral ceramidase superfamily lipid hydrolase
MATSARNGWSARLYWQWILYNSVAFVVVLTAVVVLSWIGADVLHLSAANRGWVLALLVATAGALLFGIVLGALQWQVIRQRVPVPRKRWIVANVGPSLVGWLFGIIPAVTSAQDSGTSVSGAYLLAASQTLALGPLLGLSQAGVLRGYTRR